LTGGNGGDIIPYMSYERGIQALRLQMPVEIPHTQYLSHLEYMSKITGLPQDHPDLGCKAAEVLDYDFIWSTDAPELRGRLTQMGRAHWHERQPKLDNRYQAFTDVEEALNLDCREEYGIPAVETLIQEYQARYQRCQRELYPFAVWPGGIYRTQMSFMIAAFGWEMLLTMAGLDLRRFTRVMDTWFEVVKVYFQAWACTDIEIFLTHDDMVWTQGAFIHPDWYRGELFPRYRELWRILKAAGKKVLFCSDGNFTEFVDDLAEAGAEGFIFEPLTDLDYIVKNYGQTHVIIGNADCRILTFGTPDEVRAHVREVMDKGRDCPGYFFAVGNHIPANIPLENVEACFQAYFEYRQR